MNFKRVLYVLLVMVVAAFSGVAGAAAGGFAVYRAVHQGQPTSVAAAAPQAIPASSTSADKTLVLNNTDVQSSIIQSVQQVGPAVVTVVGTIPGQATFFGQTSDQTVSGSGFFLTDQGYLVTNNHVVEGTTSVNIVLSDGTQQQATVI